MVLRIYDCPGLSHRMDITRLGVHRAHVHRVTIENSNTYGSDIDMSDELQSQLMQFLQHNILRDELASWFIKILGFLPTYETQEDGKKVFRSLDLRDFHCS